MINFIGIGAQKSGTSWAYACLYEHPEICAPIKEIHFFSRPRFEQGMEWYESHFKKCNTDAITGEFSTSYLYSEDAPERIKKMYPNVKLIAILRNPVDRAYSQYRNTIKAGHIDPKVSFETYSRSEESVQKQGLYSEQLQRYLKLFPREQMLILIYEDIKKDPIAFMKRIYQFLGVDDTFVSSMVNDEINVARTPKLVGPERAMHHIAEFLRSHGFDRFVHMIRKTGITEGIRALNTKEGANRSEPLPFDVVAYKRLFVEDVTSLSSLLDRDMRTEWSI